jgi:hypothetical protein
MRRIAMTRTVMRAELDAYLCALAGGTPSSSFLELRHRVTADALASEFIGAHDRDAIAASIARRASATDVYIGCAPRLRRSGTKHDIAHVWALWAECDGAAAAEAAMTYVPRPAIVIASGSGPNVHAYWPLRNPLSSQQAECANLRLAHAIGADRACFDATRILRPPGTWNHKRQPPTPVLPLRLEAGQTFDADDVLAHAPVVHDDRLRARWLDRPARDVTGDALLRLAPDVYVARLLGVIARPGRKVTCPFHTDRRPSLHVYPTAQQGWSCFSCGRGGSIYDLAAALWGMRTRGREFLQLRRLLLEHFAADLERPVPQRGIEDHHALS